ncbi:MAG TPA: hypothetical protein PK263_03220 [bacterium]|nr:hypothetical protein [bacterium]
MKTKNGPPTIILMATILLTIALMSAVHLYAAAARQGGIQTTATPKSLAQITQTVNASDLLNLY